MFREKNESNIEEGDNKYSSYYDDDEDWKFKVLILTIKDQFFLSLNYLFFCSINILVI
jgi:hypothetical protein